MRQPTPSFVSRRELLRLAAASGGAWVLGARPLAAQPATVPRTTRPMKIGIIGSGQQGGSVGLLWARAGHEVLFSSRNPDTLTPLVTEGGPTAKKGLPREAATFGDVILIAVPYGALPQVGKDYGALMKGKVVIDCGNPREDRDGAMANDAAAKGTGVASAQYLPGVRVGSPGTELEFAL